MRSGVRARVLVCLAVVGALIALPAAANPNDPRYGSQWGMITIGSESAWEKGTGKGIVVAIVDTGVDLSHQDLAVQGKILPGRDFLDNDDDAQDQNGHGTHVAGIAAAATFNRIGVAGTAPDAKILPVRFLNVLGFNIDLTPTEEGRAAQSVRWAVDNGAHVINMSFGPTTGSEMEAAIRYAWSKGVICVAAAGNSSGRSSGYTDQPALVVASTDASDRRSGFSNIVDKAMWGIAAPGSSILSTYYTYPLDQHNEYDELSGTSMASPHVAGAAALLRSLGLSPQQTVDRLLQTAKDLGPEGSDSTFGAGRLDLAAAVSLGANTTGGTGSGGSGAASGGSATAGGSKAKQEAAQQNPGSSQNASPGSSLGDYKDPEPGSFAASEEKKGISPKTLINVGIAVVLLGAVIGWYLWFRRRVVPEE